MGCLRPLDGAVPSDGRFLEAAEVLDILIFEKLPGLKEIPRGVKENVYFKVDNSENIRRKSSGKRAVYVDDCGAWASGGSSGSIKKSYFLCKGNKYENIQKRNNVYCKPVKRVMTPMEPQPEECKILILNRYYTHLKRDIGYRRRISWAERLPSGVIPNVQNLCLIEYIGDMSKSRCFHGNALRHNTTEYIRTTEETREKLASRLRNANPRDGYKDVVLNDILGVRNIKQVQNTKQKQERERRGGSTRKNVADDMQTLISSMHSHGFIKDIAQSRNKPPCVIAYTDEQLLDIDKFCSTDASRPSVLGVDRTFNLGPCYVTILVFQNTDLMRSNTDTHPIMLGPCYFHWDGSFETYHRFFSHIRAKIPQGVLGSEIGGSNLILGSDEERGIVKALEMTFPSATKILCARHIQQNVTRYLRSKVNISDKEIKHITADIFGNNGLLNTGSVYEYDAHSLELSIQYSEQLPQFDGYFNKVVKTLPI